MSEPKPARALLIEETKVFARDFYRAMGDRDNILKAICHALIGGGILYALIGLMWLAHVIDR